jgi:hypothetical protein
VAFNRLGKKYNLWAMANPRRDDDWKYLDLRIAVETIPCGKKYASSKVSGTLEESHQRFLKEILKDNRYLKLQIDTSRSKEVIMSELSQKIDFIKKYA